MTYEQDREQAARRALGASAEASRRAFHPHTALQQRRVLLEAAGYWAIFAELVVRGRKLRRAWVNQHLLMADMMAAQAGALALPEQAGELAGLLFSSAPA